jgi:hypothetical protein
MDRYSFIVSDLHRLLVAGLPAQKDSVRHRHRHRFFGAGASCPSDCANGRTGSNHWDLVLALKEACAKRWRRNRTTSPERQQGDCCATV